MKYLLALFLVVPICHVSAQKLTRGKTVKYNTTSPIDSELMKKSGGTNYLYEDNSGRTIFCTGLGLAAGLSAGEVFEMSVGANADLYLRHHLAFHASFYRDFIDVEHMYANGAGDSKNLSENKTHGAYNTDLGLRIYITSTRTSKKEKIVLESSSVPGSYDVAYCIQPTLPARRILAARTGYYTNRSVVNTEMNRSELKYRDKGAVRAEDGTVLYSLYYTNAFTNGGYIGLSSTLIFNSITRNTFKSTYYLTRRVRELYADIIFAGTTFDPIISDGVAHQIVSDRTGSFQTSKVGFRLGITNTQIKRRVGVSQKWEAGYRPAVRGTGWFAAITASFGLLK